MKVEINLRKLSQAGFIIMMIGLLFAVIETFYFDFHPEWLPTSKEEFTCDFISALIVGGGSSLFLFPILKDSQIKIKEIRKQLKSLNQK